MVRPSREGKLVTQEVRSLVHQPNEPLADER